MTRNFLFAAALMTAAFMSGCKPEVLPGTDDPGAGQEEIDDSVLKLESFSFLKKDNSALKQDVATVISSGAIDDGDGIGYYVDPCSLVADFKVFAGDGALMLSEVMPSNVLKAAGQRQTICVLLR